VAKKTKRTHISLRTLISVRNKNIKKYGHPTCENCQTDLTDQPFQYDHIIPVSKFSIRLSPYSKNSVWNLRILCVKCNKDKGADIPEIHYKTIKNR
jgi:5-methylcytosine-specific restriction endonuclease McrA